MIEDPCPPSEKPPRRMTGRPISRAAASASSTELAARLRAVLTPISPIFCAKIRRSSPARIDATGVPSTRTPWRASTPDASSSSPQFRAVCPPKPSRIASTFSRSMTISTNAGVTGSR